MAMAICTLETPTREIDMAGERLAGAEIGRVGGAGEVERPVDARRLVEAAGAMDGEDELAGAAVALDDAGVADADQAGGIAGR